MDPLSAIEEIIGHVDTWPTYIIHDMFIEEPNVKSVKTVATFICGNTISCGLAIDCFNACNGLKKSAVAAFIIEFQAYRENNLETMPNGIHYPTERIGHNIGPCSTSDGNG